MLSVRLLIGILLSFLLVTVVSCRAPGRHVESEPKRPAKETGSDALVESFVYELPDSLDLGELDALRILLEVEEVIDKEAFIIDFVALAPQDEIRGGDGSVHIGQTAIYKPLSNGERTEIYLDAPPSTAWVQSKDGWELHLSMEVLSGNPERRQPRVKLRIVQVDGRP